MHVIRVERHGGNTQLWGHWREGIVRRTGSFTFSSAGGEYPFHADPLPPPSPQAGQRGQLVLDVTGSLPDSVSAEGCVWGSDE
jgi:hypothetical protein